MNSKSRNDTVGFLIMSAIGLLLTLIGGLVLYHKIQLPKPTISDQQIINLPICYNHGGYGKRTIFCSGLLDINPGDSTTNAGFEISRKIRSIKGYCKVLGGYAEIENQTISIGGGSDQNWSNIISYKNKDDLLEEAYPKSYSIAVPITSQDLHRTITISVSLNVEYPVATAGGYYNKTDRCNDQFKVFIISPEEMKLKNMYESWLHRYDTISFFIFLTILGLSFIVIGILTYRRAP